MAETLEDLRRKIDAIDDQIHDLLMERVGVVESVRELKAGERVKIRPAREAEIAYRLINRHKGPFPRRALVRIWRDLITATLSFEGPFSVSVCAPAGRSAVWDAARDQYGGVPITCFENADRVVESVRDGETSVGVLPAPYGPDAHPWWRHLTSTAAETPRVIARLPFAPPPGGAPSEAEALVIAAAKHESTGRDVTCVVIETAETVSRDGFEERLKKQSLKPLATAAAPDNTRQGLRLFYAELEGFLEPGAQPLAGAAQAFGEGAGAFHIGGYAKPLTAEDLDP
ncbi:MAG: chorismate mutase [Rhodospirillales bacterium]